LLALTTAALASPLGGLVTRRHLAAALLPLGFQPKQAMAGLFGKDGPQGDLRQLVISRKDLEELAAKLKKGELKGERDDDAIVVLRTIAIQFSGTAKLMKKTAAAMPLLDASAASMALLLAARLADELRNIEEAARARKAAEQIASVEAASSVLRSYLDLAASKYEMPALSEPYASDPGEFVAQYFGVFSCEGQGLERIPGSNSCKDAIKKETNKNPFPTKKLLEFDFLTGKALKE